MEEEKIVNTRVCKLELALPSSFELEIAVCNHGFFMMAPNRWIPKSNSLERPLRIADSSSFVMVSISHSSPTSLCIEVYTDHHLTSRDKEFILVQVKRMLRLSQREDHAVEEFQRIHPTAKLKSFGRLFRAPNLFEDVVKSFLLCYCKIGKSIEMAKRLCKLQHLISTRNLHCDFDGNYGNRKRKTRASAGLEQRRITSTTNKSLLIKAIRGELDREDMKMGDFPNAHEIVSVGEEILEGTCKLGLRAHRIVEFANQIVQGKIKLDEETEGFREEFCEKFMKIKGVGPFTCDTVRMCLGVYNFVPQDSETLRHLKEVHGKGDCTNVRRAKKIVKELYDPYKPFQSLAFWLEMVESYERKFAKKLSELEESEYAKVGGDIRYIK